MSQEMKDQILHTDLEEKCYMQKKGRWFQKTQTLMNLAMKGPYTHSDVNRKS